MAQGISEESETILEKFLAVLDFVFRLVVGLFMTVVDLVTAKHKNVRGQVVVVTGAAHGLGKEICRKFARMGAKVALLDIDITPCQESAAEINSEGGEAYAFNCDVQSSEDMQRVAREICDHPDLGSVDILICNAGILIVKEFAELNDSEIRKLIDINLFGVIWTIRAFLSDIIDNNHGHIVAISSVAGHFGERYSNVYSASKFGVRGIMESLYWEMYENNKTGVKLTTVYPFYAKTNLIKDCDVYSRFISPMEAEDSSNAIVDAILYEKREAYIPWHMGFSCNVLKGLLSYRAQNAVRRLLAIKYK